MYHGQPGISQGILNPIRFIRNPLWWRCRNLMKIDWWPHLYGYRIQLPTIAHMMILVGSAHNLDPILRQHVLTVFSLCLHGHHWGPGILTQIHSLISYCRFYQVLSHIICVYIYIYIIYMLSPLHGWWCYLVTYFNPHFVASMHASLPWSSYMAEKWGPWSSRNSKTLRDSL